jgi:hypothetical protein
MRNRSFLGLVLLGHPGQERREIVGQVGRSEVPLTRAERFDA